MADIIPTIEPLGCISIPVRKLVDLIAECDAFQERAGVAGSDAALAFIHHPTFRPTEQAPDLGAVPGVLAVVFSGLLEWQRTDVNHMRPDGSTLVLLLRDRDRYPQNAAWSQADFENFVGLLIAQMAALQGVDTRLTLRTIRQSQAAQLSPPRAGGNGQNYWLTVFEIQWSNL